MNKIVLVLLGLTVVSGVGVLSWNNFDMDLQPFEIFSSFDQFDNSICTCADLEDGSFDQLNCNAFDGVPYTNPNGLCTLPSSTTDYGEPGELLSAQGCGIGFWKNNYLVSDKIMWPEGYGPDYNFNDIYHTTISQPLSIVQVVDVVAESEEDVIEVAENEDIPNTFFENGTGRTDDILLKQSEDEIIEEEVEAESISEQEVILNDESDNGPTLLEALNAEGGDMNALLRHSVAALLNAAHPDIEYPYTVVQVLELTQISIINEDYQMTIDMFEKLNENAEKPAICY